MEVENKFCVECDDVICNYYCNNCEDVYCDLCYRWLHSKGSRAKHTYKTLLKPVKKSNEDLNLTFAFELGKRERKGETKSEQKKTIPEITSTFKDLGGIDYENIETIAAYTPLRFSTEERGLLKLLEGALDVTEYTDNVDVASDRFGFRVGGGGGKSSTMKSEMNGFLSIISGLLVAGNKANKNKVVNKSFSDNEEFFKKIFEIGRRYKICNSDKMRSTYGKLLHILQDGVSMNILDFNPCIPIRTVSSLIKEKLTNMDILQDNDFQAACSEIIANGKTKEQVQDMYNEKIAARNRLVDRWTSADFSANDVNVCIDSFSDHNSHLVSNRLPIERMIQFLKIYFGDSNSTKGSFSLEIIAGRNGSKLSHDHATQFNFVLQSLTLWREVINDLFLLWILSDKDMLSEDNTYHLRNTGQGLNRMQSAPYISREMGNILGRVQRKVGRWVGLSVVHLGDRDVPNALFFIDKYTQVPRILAPLVSVIDRIDELSHDEELNSLIIEKGFTNAETLKKTILQDFFRHGFDGSGSDGGSCVDGRLTSSWNWCSKLEKKKYFPIFLLCSFSGFDGIDIIFTSLSYIYTIKNPISVGEFKK